jgi:hypothetical protein
MVCGFIIHNLWFMVYGFIICGFIICGLWFMVYGVGFRVKVSGFMAHHLPYPHGSN